MWVFTLKTNLCFVSKYYWMQTFTRPGSFKHMSVCGNTLINIHDAMIPIYLHSRFNVMDSANTPMINGDTGMTVTANSGQHSDEDGVEHPQKLTRSEKLMLIPILLVFIFMFMSYSSLAPFFPPEVTFL